MSVFNETTTLSALNEMESSPFTDKKDLQFVLFCFLFGCALLFYLAGSPYFIGWLTKLILQRFILNNYFLEDYTFEIGTVSIAWLSGTIFAHKIEIRTQQFVVLIVESRLSFFWWTNHIRSNDSFKHLQDDNKPYRVQLKFVGLECILYANKSRFDALRNIIEKQREKEQNDRFKTQYTNMSNNNTSDNELADAMEHKSPSNNTTAAKSSPYSKSLKGQCHKQQSMDHDEDDDIEDDLDDDNDLVDVSLGNDNTYREQTKSSKKQESVTMSVDENNELLKNRNHEQNENIIIHELKKFVSAIAPHWFFELCPVTRIALEKVCVVIGNLNVENYLVGSFKESEMLFYTEKNDTEKETIHPFKYAVIGKMWDSNVRFTKNDDFINNLLNINNMNNVQTEQQKKHKNKIAEADYITDSIYLFDKLLPDLSHKRDKKSKKDKNVQIAALTKESLKINRDEYEPKSQTNIYMLKQYKTMREIHGHSSPNHSKSPRKSKKNKNKKKASKNKKNKAKDNKKRSKMNVFSNKNNKKNNKKKSKSIKSSKTNPHSEGSDGYGYNTVAMTRPPSTKTGASSVTTNDDNKTFITHSSHYTHSSQRSHRPYTSHNYYNRHSRHHTAGTHTTHTTHTTDSGETNGSNNSLELADNLNINNNVLNVPCTKMGGITIKINNELNVNTNANSPMDTPMTSFYPRLNSEMSQPTIIHENIDDKGTVTTDQQSSVDTGPFQFGKRLKAPTNATGTTTDKSSASTEDPDDNKYGDPDIIQDEDQLNSTDIIQIDSFSFFFTRDSPAQLTNDNYIDAFHLDEQILPQQKFEVVVHNQCIINYGPYADDLRSKLMSNFLPFMFQHRECTPLIPTNIGEYFNFATLDIIIKFEEPRFQLDADKYSDTASSLNSDEKPLKSQKYNMNIPWFIFNIPFSANIDDEARRLEEEKVIDNHLMQIKFGANSLIKISIPWMVPDCNANKCDATCIDLSLTPCNISSSIRKSELYHSIIDTDKFLIKYKWLTPLKWNDLQKHEIELTLIKIDRISKIYFLSEHINVFTSLSTDWFSYRPEVTIEYFVPSVTTIKLHAKESEIVTCVNYQNVIHLCGGINFLEHLHLYESEEFLDNPTNARLKWKGIIDMELSLPSTDWKPSVSNMNMLLEMRMNELFLELPSQHPFTDMMPNNYKKRCYDDHQCLTFRKAKFSMNYIYHNVYYREHRDSMNISIDVTDPEFKIYGHFLRYYWNFIQNYSSVYSEFLTMEEFRNEYKFNNTTAFDKRKKLRNTGQKKNSFEVYTQICVHNASLILPSSIIGTTNHTNYQQKMMNSKHLKPKLKFEELMLDFRTTDEYNNMYIHCSPIRCMIPLTEQEQSNKNNINTFLSIDSFVLKRQSWNGLPPQYLTYSQSINGDIGKIKIQLFDCQLQRLIHSINAFMLQYNNSFDSRCFDFREREHLISATNDNPDQIDYPSEELSIMNINFDIKSIDICIYHNINMFRYQHITRCICPYGIQIKSSSESTLEFAQKTVILCNKIELQHLISTAKPNDEKKAADMDDNIRNRRGNIRNRKGGQNKKEKQNKSTRQRGKNQRNRKYDKANKNKFVKDDFDLLCVGSLDSHFQIILTTERSDQEVYQSKQRNFENIQLQQTEDDVEMDQDWPFHLLNTIYMQEPLPKHRAPNRNPKNMPVYQQTELEYELYGNHSMNGNRHSLMKNNKKNMYTPDIVLEEEDDEELGLGPVPEINPFDSDDGKFYDTNDEDDSAGTGLIVPGDKQMLTADEDTDTGFHTAEEFPNSPKPGGTRQNSADVEDSNVAVEAAKMIEISGLQTPSPETVSSNMVKPPRIITEEAETDDDENYQRSMKQFHVSNYMAKYEKSRGPTELGQGWKKPRHLFHVNADYVPLPEISYKITAPSLLRKYMNNSNIMTPRPGGDFGWGLQVSPRRLQQQQTQDTKDNDDKSTLHITYRTHVNIADNTSIVITPEFLDSIHVYMRLLQPKTHSLSEVLDEMQEFVCDFYHGTYSPHYDINRQRQYQHAANSRISQNTPTFVQFKQKKIISAIIGAIHIQSLERAEKAPGIFLLDARISHISIEHCKSYTGTPWKTVMGDILNTDTIIHFANASFQGFKASPSVDRSNGMPVEIKEWGHVLDPALLFETENTEYFIGIEMSDSCVRRTQYMSKEHIDCAEEEVKGNGVDEDNVIPSENMINLQNVKVSTSSTAFANVATLIYRFRRYVMKISQEIPWQNVLKMDRLKLVVGEMLTAVSALQNIKAQPWHRHFLEWLQLRILSEQRKQKIKEAICGWDQKQYIKRNNYTRASGIVFMVIIRNLIGNLAPRVERKLNDGFLNVAQQYLDPQYLHSHHTMNNTTFHHRYSNQNAKMDAQHIRGKRYLFAAQKEQFYSRKVDEFGKTKKIAHPIIRQCFIELTKELQEIFFPKQNTTHLKYKESIKWNISKTSFEVIQDHEKSFEVIASQFHGFLKIKSCPPQDSTQDHGTYTVTISTSIKNVTSQAKPASLDALFSFNRAFTDLSKQNMNNNYQQQYNNNMYRFGSESYLIPPSYSNPSSSNTGSTYKGSAVFRALRYSKPGNASTNTDKMKGDNTNNYYPYYNVTNSNNPYGQMTAQQRWITKIQTHIKFGAVKVSISTPECADLDIQIIKLSLVSNRSILPPPIGMHQSGNINSPQPQHHSHSHSPHSSGSSFSGFRDEYHHILVNIWKMDARLLLAVELDDVSSGGHSQFSTMSTFDDRQVIFKLGLHEPTISISSIPNLIRGTNINTSNDDFHQRGYSTSTSVQVVGNTKTTNINVDTPRTEPHTPIPLKTATPLSKNTKNAPQNGSYIEQVSIAIDAEKCVSQILFDRILDSKSNRKRLDLKQLVEPWLTSIQQNVKKSDISSIQNNLPSWDYNESVEIQPRCIDLVANLEHFKFRSWISEKCVCIYTLESITSHFRIPNNSHHTAAIEAGKKQHKLDFIVYKAPQASRRMAKDIQSYIHNPHIASINTQKFPYILTRIVTKKESQTSPIHKYNSEKYSSFEIGSVADEDELYEKSEKVTIVATIALSKMNAQVSEKMFGSLIRLYSRLRNEASTVIKVYEEISDSVSKIKHNFLGKHSPEHTVLTKCAGYLPQTTIQVNIAFEGLDANISLTDTPNVRAVAKSGPLNLQIVYTPEYLPVRTDKIAMMLNSADYISLEVWDEATGDGDDEYRDRYGDENKVVFVDDDEYDSTDSESSSSGPFSCRDELDDNDEDTTRTEEQHGKRKHVKSKLYQTFSNTRIVINDKEMYKANKSKRKKPKKLVTKNSTSKRTKRKLYAAAATSSQQKSSHSVSSESHDNIRPILPLHARSNIEIIAFVQKVRDQWHVSQDVNLMQTQIQLTPSVVTVLQMLMYKYEEEFKTTVSTNVIQEIDGIKRVLLSRMPSMQNFSSTQVAGARSALLPDYREDTEFGTHLSWTNTNTIAVNANNINTNVSVTSSQKKHDKNITKPNSDKNYPARTDQLSVPAVSPSTVHVPHSTTFSLHSGQYGNKERKKKLRPQMVETEAIDMLSNHIYFTSMVSVKNFLCVAVLGQHYNADRPLLSTHINHINNRGDNTEQIQFVSLYCHEAQAGIKSNDLYAQSKQIKLTIDIRASNVIAGLDEKVNIDNMWKIERYQHFENIFSNRWRFIEFNARSVFKHSLHCLNKEDINCKEKQTNKYFIKSNIVVADVKSIIQPNILQLIINITDINNEFDVNPRGVVTELIGGDKANNSMEQNMLNVGNKKQMLPNWDLDINFEWRGGKLSLATPNPNKNESNLPSVISLPYIKLFSSISLSPEQIESDTFVLINFDKISLDMHFLHFVGATIECLNIASTEGIYEHHINKESNNNNNKDNKNKVSNHTLCVSIANLNTTLSCQPIYDKLECVFNVNDPISICWCHTSLDLDAATHTSYTDILTISIPKVSMKILQKSHSNAYNHLNKKNYGLMTHIRFDLDIQRSQGHNLRADGLPIITTLISLEKVVIHTSALGIITTNLFIKCIEKQLSIPKVPHYKASDDPHSPFHNNKHSNLQQYNARYILFCIKDKIRFVCDLTDLPLISTHIKAGLDQFVFLYQDDGFMLNNNKDHLIRARLTYHGFIEFSDRSRSSRQRNTMQNNNKSSQHSATSMLNNIKNLAAMAVNVANNQSEPGSSWKRKRGALMKKLEPLQGSFRMNDVMTISFLHHYNPNNNLVNNQNNANAHNPFNNSIKCGINRLQISVPQTNILLKTLTLRKLIEMNTTSAMHIEIQDSPPSATNNNADFVVNILLELEEGIVLRLAPHSIPYLLSAYYTIAAFMKREQNDIATHLQEKKEKDGNLNNNNNNKEEDDGNGTKVILSKPELTLSKQPSLSESVFTRYYTNRGLSPLSWKSQLSASDFFGPTDRLDPDTPLFVIGNFELKARSVGLILYVDNNQKNNYVRLHLNYFKFLFNRKCKEYLEDDHTQLIEDDINVYFGIKNNDNSQERHDQNNGKVEHGLYVVPIQFILDPNALKNEQNHAALSSTKDLIAVPVCHLHYNAKTNIDDFSVTDIFDAKWGNQTFILPLDLRPFDNIGKTFKKYHRDYNEIIIKHKKNEKESLKTINEKERLSDQQQQQQQQQHTHKKSQTSSTSISSQMSNKKQSENNNKRTFNHDTYKFEPPFPSVKYIVSADTILEKLGIQTPQNTIPETFYSSIVEPISSSFRIIRDISQEIDSKLSPMVDDQQ